MSESGLKRTRTSFGEPHPAFDHLLVSLGQFDAIQIDGIWRDLFQSLEKTRDAMRSSSGQVDGEMSPEFAGLDNLCRHMTKKWRGTAPPGGVLCSGQRGNAGRVRCCMHRRLDVARSGKCGREFAPSIDPWENRANDLLVTFMTNRRGVARTGTSFKIPA